MKSIPIEFTDMMQRIPLDECKNRFLYRINSRNLDFGVFKKATNGFIGIRNKFGEDFLFTEYHCDTGAPYGTVYPQEKLEPMPKGMRLEEVLKGIFDWKTKRPIASDKPVSEGGRGWYYIDTGEVSDKICPVRFQNIELFNWLKEKEKQYAKL